MVETVRRCDICGRKLLRWNEKIYKVKRVYNYDGCVINKLDICADCWDEMGIYIRNNRKENK